MGRKKLDRSILNVRVDSNTPKWFKQKAFECGYSYNEEGATGQFLDAIAQEHFVLVPAESWNKCLTLIREICKNSNCEGEKTPHNNQTTKEVK